MLVITASPQEKVLLFWRGPPPKDGMKLGHIVITRIKGTQVGIGFECVPQLAIAREKRKP